MGPGPSFQPNPEEIQNISSNSDADNTILLSSGDIASRAKYIRCSLSLSNVTFCSTYAFGGGSLTYSSGGAIYSQSSDVAIAQSSFANCSALVGGALSLVNSHLLINPSQSSSSTFSFCTAYKMAGALFFIGASSLEKLQGFVDPRADAMIRFSSFVSCTSLEAYGAAFFQNVQDLYISSSAFQNCTAGHSAGAVGIQSSFAYIVNSSFTDNKCAMTAYITNMSRKTERKLSIPKGGGAILFTTFYQPPQNASHSAALIDLVTLQCCFYGNSVSSSMTLGDGLGFDILFSGECYWRSYSDSFALSEASAIGYVSRNSQSWGLSISLNVASQNYSVAPTAFGMNSSLWCSSISSNNITFTRTSTLSSITAASMTDFGVSEIPSPSNFVYASTFLTKLPYETSYSRFAGTSCTRTFSKTSLKIQSATPSKSMTPSRSSFAEIPSQTGVSNITYSLTVTNSYFWEVPSTVTASSTAVGDVWPTQTPSLTSKSPSRSSFGQLPERTPSESELWAIPDASAIATISFQYEIPSTATASSTAIGATWPLQTMTAPIATISKSPTRSSFGGIPDQSPLQPTQSSLWAIPDASPEATISFEFEPSPSPKPTETGSGTWPSQTATCSNSMTPTRSSFNEVQSYSATVCTPTDSSLWEIPNQSPMASISFQFEVPSTVTASSTASGATWPSQTPSPSRPTRSPYLQPPETTGVTPTISMLWEIPNQTPVASISFQFEVPSTATASSTASGATWPSQTPSPSSQTPTRSSFGRTIVSISPSKSSDGDFVDSSAMATISFQFEVPSTVTASSTAVGVTWPSQTPSPSSKTPTRSSNGQSPIATSKSPTATNLWAIPDASAVATISFQYEIPSTAKATMTAIGASWPLQTPSPTKVTASNSTIITSCPTQSSLWAVPDASPMATISFEFELPPSATPTATPTASRTLNADESYVMKSSATLIASMSQTVSVQSVVVVVSSYTFATDENGESSYTAMSIDSVQLVYINTFMLTYVQSNIIFAEIVTFTSESADSLVSKGLIIGLSTGAGFVVMVVAIAIVYVLRSGKRQASSDISSSSEAIIDETSEITKKMSKAFELQLRSTLDNENDVDDLWIKA